MHLYTPFTCLADRIERLFTLVSTFRNLCSTDAGAEGLADVCTIEAQCLIDDLAEPLDDIQKTLDLYPSGECFSFHYNSYISRFDDLVRALPTSRKSNNIKKLKDTLKKLNKMFQDMNKALNSPTTDKKKQIYDYVLSHYHSYSWYNDSIGFFQFLDTIATSNLPVLLKRLRKKHQDNLQLLYSCEFIKLRATEYASPQEAYDSLRKSSGPDGLDPLGMVAHMRYYSVQLKDYPTINRFFMLNLFNLELEQRIADIERQIEQQESEAFHTHILKKVEPLFREHDHHNMSQHLDLFRLFLADPEILERFRESQLDEDYNLKLMLNILGIMRTERLLDISSSAIGSNFGTKRRDSYIKSTNYLAFGSSFSALTQPLYDRILAIVKSVNASR